MRATIQLGSPPFGKIQPFTASHKRTYYNVIIFTRFLIPFVNTTVLDGLGFLQSTKLYIQLIFATR